MFEKLEKIEIPFHDGSSLTYPLFFRKGKSDKKTDSTNCFVMYGRNGSGKSTFARALAKNSVGIKYIDSKGQVIHAGENPPVFVYSDTFVSDEFMEVKRDCLQPIVLLGESVDNQHAIEKLDSRLVSLKSKLTGLENEHEKIRISLESSDKEIRENGLFPWRERTRKYTENGDKKKLTQNRYEDIVKRCKPKIDQCSIENDYSMIDKLKEEFDEKCKRIKFLEGEPGIAWKAPSLEIDVDINKINTMLSSVPTSTEQISGELEQRVRHFEAGIDKLVMNRDTLYRDEGSYCPNCLQDISSDFASKITKLIDQYLTGLENEGQLKELNDLRISWSQDLNIDIFEADKFPSVQLVCQDKERLVSFITEINEIIEEKINHPAAQSLIDSDEFEEIVNSLKSSLKDLELSVEAHNSQVSKLQDELKTVEDLNNEIAALEIKYLLKEHASIESRSQGLLSEIESHRREISECSSELEILQSKQKSSGLAAEKINDLLRLTLGEKAFRIEARQDGYHILNRSTKVDPGSLSTGERNILSLCYFIVKIADQKSIAEAFKNDMLIVFDDPVSSFDQDNKYGVMTLLNWFFQQCLQKESRAKVGILTHDLVIANSMIDSLKNYNMQPAALEIVYGEGANHENLTNVNYYSCYLKEMYEAAMYEVDEAHDRQERNVLVDPNHIRKVYEAFIVFELNQSNLSAAHTSKGLVEYMEAKGDAYASLLRSYPGRNFVNTDSHSRSQILGDNFNLLFSLDCVNQQRYIRETLCIMYAVAPLNIVGHLAKKDEDRSEIETNLRNLTTSILSTKPF